MNDDEVILRCRGGDIQALEMLYERYAQRALRTAYLITSNHFIAEEAVQEAFIQVWKSIHQLRDTKAFHAWFFRILINRVKDLGKKNGSSHLVHLENAANMTGGSIEEPEKEIERKEDFQQVQVAIAMLPETQRIPLILRYYLHMSEAEISETLAIPTGTVKSRLFAARTKLQRLLVRYRIDKG